MKNKNSSYYLVFQSLNSNCLLKNGAKVKNILSNFIHVKTDEVLPLFVRRACSGKTIQSTFPLKYIFNTPVKDMFLLQERYYM